MPLGAPLVNIESGFFYYNCPRSRKEVDVLSERRITYKHASSKAPLLPGQVLAMTNYMVSYHDPPSPGTRELPLLIQKGTAHFMTIPQLVLQAPIHVGDGKWSQVWKGIMTSKDFPDVPPASVVVKLFQESYLSFGPCIRDFWGKFDSAEWLPGARMAANEAWAYDRMRALQGCTVPWSYGFCKCVLPTGETTFGHVMELIDGPTTCAMTADELGLNETGIFNFGDALGMAVHKMHQCGVGHGDLKGDNVIIYFNSSNQECDVVLLDFALCMALEPPTHQALIVEWDIASIPNMFRALGIMEYARSWFRSRLELSVPYGATLTELDRQGWLEEDSKEEIPEYAMPDVTLAWGGRKAREGLFNWHPEELQPGEVHPATDETGLYGPYEGWPQALPAWGCGNTTEGLSAWYTEELQQAGEVDTAPDVFE
ncbi:hypothetical protein JB92DRAFT_2933731 [Gautieria morchelliformis]|nr:hypothetical protein JB92DRAFT_2933731 [Gautieria morchelliformis]